MSRRYRVRVRETLRRVVKAQDEVRSQLEMLEILPAAEMAELLAQELAARGFKRQGNKAVRTKDQVQTTVDLASGEVAVRASKEKEVAASGEREGYAYDDTGPGNAEMRRRIGEQIRQALEKDVAKQSAGLQSAVTDALERHVGDVAAELDQAVNRATAEALKRKAAQLGRIKQLADDPQTGSLTIVVEV